uniref:Uncharacterized protein n=1 Tax=Anguilla anguilla TaxID=7936 RepID=A0A0E9VU75_ANGAN
MWTWISWLR